MTAERLVWVVDQNPVEVVADLVPDRTPILGLPADGDWELAPLRLVWAVTVGSLDECAAVLDAVLRGVAVVVSVRADLGASAAARFVDDLHRVASHEPPIRRALSLAEDQRRLLDALSRGATLNVAAARLGISTRTASRRLADARRVLGCTSNAEAVRLHAANARS